MSGDKKWNYYFKKNINNLWILFGMMITVVYIVNWWNLPARMNQEIPWDLPNFLAGECVGIKDFVSKVFNMNMIEFGKYRPRILAFIVQYLDIKLWVGLNKILPDGILWGGHWPFVLLGIPITILGGLQIFKFFLQKTSIQFRFFLATTLLFFPNYISTTFLFLRTAKLLSPAIAWCLIGYFLEDRTKVCVGGGIKQMTY